MVINKKIKTIFAALALVLVLSFGGAQLQIAQAYSLEEFGGDAVDWLSSGGEEDPNQVTTFSDFKGGLSAPTGDGLDASLKKATDARSYIISIVNFVLGFLGLAAVIVIVYAGILYVTSAGNDDNLGKAKNAIKYAVIGILIIAGSYAMVNTIVNFTQGDNGRGTIAADGTAAGAGAGGQNLRGTNSNQSNVYNFAANEIRKAMNDILNAYKNYIAVDNLVKKLSNVAIPSSSSEYRSFISEVNNIVIDAKNNSNDFSEVKRVTSEFSNGPLVKLLNISNKDLALLDKEDEDAEKFYKKFNTNCLVRSTDVVTQAGQSCEGYPKVVSELGETPSTPHQASLPFGLQTAARDDFIKTILMSVHDTDPTKTDAEAKRLGFTDKGKLLIIQSVLGTIANTEVEGGTSIATFMESNKDLAKAFAGIDPTKSVYSMFEEAKTQITGLEKIKGEPGSAANSLLVTNALKSAYRLYLIVLNLKYVDVKVHASVTSGNAPVIVELNGLESRDPNNTTIADENYKWCIDDCTSEGVGSVKRENVFSCSTDTGPTTICTFNKAGTYIVRLSIKSADPQHVADGVGSLAITVKPSLANIKLSATIPGIGTTLIRGEREGSTPDKKLFEDVTTIEATREAARSGITFDATGSEGGDGQKIEDGNFSWNFGDGTNTSNEKKKIITHSYTREGRFPLILEVTDNARRKGRKIVTVIVSSIAAKIDYKSLDGEPGELLEFDGSASKSDNGPILSYNWSITKKDSERALSNGDVVEIIGGSESPTLRAKFLKAGEYKVSLEVDDGNKKADTKDHPLEIIIKSHKPRAALHVNSCPDNCPVPSDPAVVEFDSSGSFDPDSDDNLNYTWSFYNDVGDLLPESPQTYQIIERNNIKSSDSARTPEAGSVKKMKVKFAKKGKYKVNLVIKDHPDDQLPIQQKDIVDQTFEVTSIVGLQWDDAMKSTAQLVNNRATITFSGTIENADSADIDFGDGETAEVPLTGTDGRFSIEHMYDQAKEYVVTLNAQSENNGDNSVKKRIVIAPGDQPRAVIHVFEDDTEVVLPETIDPANPQIFEVIRGQRVTFDATQSITSKGSQHASDLTYMWDFGDGDTSTKDRVSHTYQELTGEGEITYIRLTVTERSNSTKTHTTQFPLRVVSSKPVLTALTIEKQSAGNTTPVEVLVRAEGARDLDGRITNYQFWYYHPDHPEERFSVVDTTSNSAPLTVETYGQAGDEHEFVFCVELTDSDNTVATCNSLLDEGRRPHLLVKNGPNKAPTASFEVQPSTSVKVNEELVFTSSSTDEDGEVKQYIWDLEGDGFQNNNPTESPSITHRYTKKSPANGYKVKLKVIDDKNAAGYSRDIPIMVFAPSNEPRANFRYEADSSIPLRVRFFDASTPDQQNQARIVEWKWDFDGTQEFGCSNDNRPEYCNGNKTDDVDSTDQFPVFDFPTTGRYQVKLTVTDNFDNEGTTTQFVQVSGGSSGSTNSDGTGAVARPRDQRAVADLKAYYDNRFSVQEGEQKVLRIPANACAASVAFYWGDSRANDVPAFKLEKNTYHDANGDGNRANDYQDVSIANECVMNGIRKNNCTNLQFQRFDQQTTPRGSGQFETELAMLTMPRDGTPATIIDKDTVKVVFDKYNTPQDLTPAQCGQPANNFGASIFKDIGLSNSLIFSVIGGMLAVLGVLGIQGVLSRGKLRNDQFPPVKPL